MCDGRLGLALATKFLTYFEEETGKYKAIGGNLTACAGVAIVKSHFPFARAYELAEELCKSAKDDRKEKDVSGSCLNWHFALSGILNSLKTIRDTEYKTDSGRLDQRPVTLSANTQDTYASWPLIESATLAFQSEDWAERRNKMKALRHR